MTDEICWSLDFWYCGVQLYLLIFIWSLEFRYWGISINVFPGKTITPKLKKNAPGKIPSYVLMR